MATTEANVRPQDDLKDGKFTSSGSASASKYYATPHPSLTKQQEVLSTDRPSRPRPAVSYKIALDSQVNALIDAEDASNIVYKNWSTKSPAKKGVVKARRSSTSFLKRPLRRRHSHSTAKSRLLQYKGDGKAERLPCPISSNSPLRKDSTAIKQTTPVIAALEKEASTDDSSLSSEFSDTDDIKPEPVSSRSFVSPSKRRRDDLPKRLNMTRPGGSRALLSDDDDNDGILLGSDTIEEKAADFRQLIKPFSYQNPDSAVGSSIKPSDTSSSHSPNSIPLKREEDEASPGTIGSRKRESVDSSSMLEPSPSKKSKPNRGYAPPSTYAHLKSIADHIPLYADVLICGINPGTTSSVKQHHFAHKGNLFWPCLNASGLVKGENGTPITCEDDHTLPARFNIGITNLVHRPTAEAGELSQYELSEHVPKLVEKIRKFQPRIVCLVGKGIWQAIEEIGIKSGDLVHDNWAEEQALMAADLYANLTTSPMKNPKKPFTWGLQPYVVYHDKDGAKDVRKSGAINGGKTYFFVVMSTSGRVAAYRKDDRTIIFTECRRFVAKLRAIHPSTEKHIKEWKKSLKYSTQPTEAEI